MAISSEFWPTIHFIAGLGNDATGYQIGQGVRINVSNKQLRCWYIFTQYKMVWVVLQVHIIRYMIENRPTRLVRWTLSNTRSSGDRKTNGLSSQNFQYANYKISTLQQLEIGRPMESQVRTFNTQLQNSQTSAITSSMEV